MNGQKPATIPEYLQWLRERHGVQVQVQAGKNRFDSVATRIRDAFQASPFWKDLIDSLKEFDDEYLVSTAYRLFVSPAPAVIEVKPFESFLLKTFRRNILESPHFPEAPEGGWLLPDDWYSRISDIVRTCLVVKYLDGVEFMAAKIEGMCSIHGCQCDLSYEAREEGYYAAHVIVHGTAEIPREDWDSQRIPVALEIQITTQLQEVIRKLLHEYYDRRRSQTERADVKWQWNYKSDEFIANYLGHVLHYAEGMIMEVRNRQAELAAAKSRKEPVS